MVDLSKMVIFHSYVKQPNGITNPWTGNASGERIRSADLSKNEGLWMGRFYRNIAGLGDFEYFFDWEFKKECFFCLKLFSGPKNGCKRISPKLRLEILHTWEMILGASMIQSYMYSQPIVGVVAD